MGRRSRFSVALFASFGLLLCSGGAAVAAPCPNEAVRDQQGSTFLPDCRAYEMVTPVEKGGASIFRVQSQAGPSGGSLLFSSAVSFGDSPSASRLNFYRSDRGAGAWSSSSVSAPIGERLTGQNSTLKGVTDDLGAAVVETTAQLSADPITPGVATLYRKNADGTYDLVIPKVPGGFEGLFYAPEFIAGSQDYHRVLFRSPVAQTPDAPAEISNLYEWVDGELHLVTILPDDECEALSLPPGCAAPSGVGGENFFYPGRRHLISTDGSRIFFPVESKLYVRENGTTTRRIGSAAAVFQQATPNGSKLLYGDPNGLVLYDLETEIATRLAPDTFPVGMSDDGSHVYLMSRAVLAAGAVAGVSNLYHFHDGTYDLIGILENVGAGSDSDAWSYLTMNERAITPDGRYLVFHSDESLTGYDNTSPSCVDETCLEFYRYDAADGSLICVSCNPNGPPRGDAGVSLRETGITTSVAETAVRYLSADGSRVFFNSPDPLASRDSNGQLDVYAWEEGAGAQLVSTGRSGDDSSLLGSSASGDDAFFWTTERLVGLDRDDLADAYDARIGGGIGTQMPPPAAPPCSGETCRVPVLPPSPAGITGSSAYSGPQNAKPKRKKAKKKHGKHKRTKKKTGKSSRRASR